MHLAHSYNAQTGDREQRLQKALAEMGVSITSGLITTFGACCALFATQLLWFKLFGCFIAMLIFSSYITAMVGLTSCLALYGPGDGEGLAIDLLPEPIKKYFRVFDSSVSTPEDNRGAVELAGKVVQPAQFPDDLKPVNTSA